MRDERLNHRTSKRVAEKYGEAKVEVMGYLGQRRTVTRDLAEVNEVQRQSRIRHVAELKEMIGTEKLDIANEITDQYAVDEFMFKDQDEMTTEEKIRYVDSSKEFKESIREAYRKGEIDDAEFLLYKDLIVEIYNTDYDAIQ